MKTKETSDAHSYEMNNVQLAVTIYLTCKDKVLLLKRGEHKRTDPGLLNGVGGRLEKGENFVQAAIRETEEETGYKVTDSHLKLIGFAHYEGIETSSWMIHYFTAEVESENIPIGNETDDGELIWFTKEEVGNLEKGKAIDTLNYFKPYIFDEKDKIIFLASGWDTKKVLDPQISILGK